MGEQEARELWGNVEHQAKHEAARLESVVRAQRENGENGFDVGLQGHLKRQRSSSRYQLRAALTIWKYKRVNADERRLFRSPSKSVQVGATVKEHGENAVMCFLFGFHASLGRFLAQRSQCNETLRGGQDANVRHDLTKVDFYSGNG